jgi:hypothetical protein
MKKIKFTHTTQRGAQQSRASWAKWAKRKQFDPICITKGGTHVEIHA